MIFPEPDAPNGGYQPLTALKVLREASKVLVKRFYSSAEPTPDELADFANAVMIANSVEEANP